MHFFSNSLCIALNVFILLLVFQKDNMPVYYQQNLFPKRAIAKK